MPEEIPGTWVFTEHTKEFFSEQKILGEPPEKLYLRMQKDGSFIARIPEEENHSHWVYRTLAGTWELEYKKDGFLKKNTLNLEIGFPKGTWFFNFSEEKGQLVLWQYIGDPDSMDFMEFIKED
ncbi:MAG: hypothetical protein KC618_05015 [Candidatus Omnitrophica bacterium]|nr:hypothetical protein [Candidatus Omnitrophota bacterium]